MAAWGSPLSLGEAFVNEFMRLSDSTWGISDFSYRKSLLLVEPILFPRVLFAADSFASLLN